MCSLIPIQILKIGDFQLPPKSDSFIIQLVLKSFFYKYLNFLTPTNKELGISLIPIAYISKVIKLCIHFLDNHVQKEDLKKLFIKEKEKLLTTLTRN